MRRTGSRLVAGVLVVLLLAVTACDGEKEAAKPTDVLAVSLGVSKESMSALAYVARDEGIFEANGLDVEFTEYESAQLALNALLAGDVDAALCADTPIAIEAVECCPVRIVCTVATDANDLKVVARRDVGIVTPDDLRGKRVGTRSGTAAHFFLHGFLIKHGMSDADVDMRFGSFEDVTAALIAGELDAVALRQPFIAELQSALGDRFLLFEEEGLYEKTMNLCVRPGDSPAAEVKRRLVSSLIDAEKRAVGDTSGHMREEVAAAIDVTEGDLCSCLFSAGAVTLRQSLILTLEDQARWAVQSGVAQSGEMPDFLEMLDTQTLESIDAERVTVIR
jgi:NitT/TauT family transport system substrate-binding protein